AAGVLLNRIEASDVSSARALAAQARTQWTINLHDTARRAQSRVGAPFSVDVGDAQAGGVADNTNTSTAAGNGTDLVQYTDFADDFVRRMNDGLADQRNQLKTEAGRRMFDDLANGIKTDLTTHATFAQSDLAGVKAKSDFLATVDQLRNTLLVDPTKLN